jgi:hypothetical protein
MKNLHIICYSIEVMGMVRDRVIGKGGSKDWIQEFWSELKITHRSVTISAYNPSAGAFSISL